MDLESVIQSKVSQKEKSKYANTYIWNLKKKKKMVLMNLCQGRNEDVDIENGLEDMVDVEGEAGTK